MLTTIFTWTANYAGIFVAGFGLGFFFYGGLWWTVRRAPTSDQPALLILVSFFLRTLVIVGGFYWIMDGQLVRLAVAMGGFLLSRLLLVRRWGSSGDSTDRAGRSDGAQAKHVTPGGVTYDLAGRLDAE